MAREEVPSNHLYRDMAMVIEALAPRAFVFENVRGLLSSRWHPDGERGEIWADVQETFSALRGRMGDRMIEYATRSAVVRAADYGVPQNRPRVLLVGVREDIDVPASLSLTADGFLPDPAGAPPNLAELLDDLVDADWSPGGTTERYPCDPATDVQRALRTLPSGALLEAGAILRHHEYARHKPQTVEKFAFMLASGGAVPEGMRTKKFAQRVLPRYWDDRGPTITATSLPDDYVHYAQPRVPTVREWARLQTFPDWYSFAGRRTTGGRRRAGDPSVGMWARDLPHYTQIGNAVPVSLAHEIGKHIARIVR
jgi:DNA (cytosine-5)-methyltransferase 1